jgi:hypothetical protein
MSTGVLITREPVVNQHGAITANRLLIHAPNITTALRALEGQRPHWPTLHPVFISFDCPCPTQDLLDWQFPDNALIEIPTESLDDPASQSIVAQLAAAGVPLVLSGYTPDRGNPAPVDWRFTIINSEVSATPGNTPGLPLAWGLPDAPSFKHALGRGYTGAVGWFFLKGVTVKQKLAPSHAQIVRLLNLVRNDSDITEIEQTLKQDVSLPYKLLRYINSAGFGLMVEVQSFRHAVTILGRDRLNKWLSLLLISASKDPSAPAVMQAAIARGRMMEILGAQFFDTAQVDNLFITGAFSLLDVLLGSPIEVILDQMTLPDAIRDALLHHQGAYAALLGLAIASESASCDDLGQQSDALGLSSQQVSAAILQAVAFADNLSCR